MTPQPLPHFFLNWGFGNRATPCPGAQRGVLTGSSLLVGGWPRSWLCLSGVLLPVPVPGGTWWQGTGCCWQQHTPSTGCSHHPPFNASQDIGNGMSWVLVTTLPLTACDSVLLQRLPLLGQGCVTAQLGTPWLSSG